MFKKKKKQKTETAFEGAQMLDLSKKFKGAIINIFIEVNDKELKKDGMTMSY